MIKHKNTLKNPAEVYSDVMQDEGNVDYVVDGKIYRNAPLKSVLVGSQSDLALLQEYEPGTIAFTAGYANIWQKSTSGEWVEI